MPHPFSIRQLLACLFIASFSLDSYSQKIVIADARFDVSCRQTHQLIESKPGEVLFGIRIDKKGDVYFTMNSRAWFDKIFTSSQDGVTADLITKDLYGCNKTSPSYRQLPKGQYMQPVYLNYLKQNMKDEGMGNFAVKIGTVPADLKKKAHELEGNLVILKNGVVCYYTNFLDIDRSLWALLPMGLHTDTVISTEKLLDTTNAQELLYTKKLQFTIPFAKSKSVYNKADLKPLYDSLHLADYRILKMDIRAYSSVEGAEKLNQQLQQARANSMIQALQQYQSPDIQKQVTATENWVEFLEDIQRTPFATFAGLSREAIKTKLQDKTVADQLEPILKNHRKAIVTIYLNKKSGLEAITDQNLSIQFKNALAQKNIYKASLIQEEVYARIADNRLPEDYADKLEIPQEKQYSLLLSDRETYKYQLGLTGEEEALENFRTLFKLDSASGRIRYNICALSFQFWQFDTTFLNPKTFLQDINALYRFKIDHQLIKRMLINYHILSCEHSMYRGDYAAKDRYLQYIIQNYGTLQLADEEVLSLAKYLCFYAQFDEAEKLVTKRVQSIDVNEDLLFYYLNLKLFNPEINFKAMLKKEINNAINLNRPRFCRFFNSINDGGASFQALENGSLKEIYCEHCQVK
ncbi:hypothetical protein HB364_31095 [Pseudoflavitalea sp. X16]|uniref:hypothetical protein n=1 Tax=Paraflavitalea devenefica TaxID=2716334 RepID=UPI001422C096|nr:hypothetical protein [Paraflavitalea devenefica]NII29567.1 hypothetical protein [Paraflavitalea devenefica]